MKERAARLLSGKDVPSVLERESLAKSVLDESVGQRDAGRAPWRLTAALVVGAACVFFVVMSVPEELVPRSGDTGPTFETICRPGPDCEVGGQLMFRVSNAPKELDHIAIFAQRPDGLVIWYFPTEERDMSTSFTDSKWMEEGVALVGAHEPGLYVIHALLSEEPMTRAQVREQTELGGDDTHELLRTQVMLKP